MWLGIGIKIVNWLWRGPSGPFNGHATLTNDLVSAWPLSEDGFDSHGTNDLTNNNGVTFVAKGGGAPANMPANIASLAAASNQYFDIATSILDPTANFTLSVWQPSQATGAGYGAVYFGSPTAQILMQGVNQGGDNTTPDFRVFTGVAAQVTGAAINGGSPHLLIATWVASTKTLEVFVDGASIGSNSGSGAAASATALLVGKHHGGGLHNGTLSSAYFWSRALTAGELTDLWNSGAGLFY